MFTIATCADCGVPIKRWQKAYGCSAADHVLQQRCKVCFSRHMMEVHSMPDVFSLPSNVRYFTPAFSGAGPLLPATPAADHNTADPAAPGAPLPLVAAPTAVAVVSRPVSQSSDPVHTAGAPSKPSSFASTIMGRTQHEQWATLAVIVAIVLFSYACWVDAPDAARQLIGPTGAPGLVWNEAPTGATGATFDAQPPPTPPHPRKPARHVPPPVKVTPKVQDALRDWSKSGTTGSTGSTLTPLQRSRAARNAGVSIGRQSAAAEGTGEACDGRLCEWQVSMVLDDVSDASPASRIPIDWQDLQAAVRAQVIDEATSRRVWDVMLLRHQLDMPEGLVRPASAAGGRHSDDADASCKPRPLSAVHPANAVGYLVAVALTVAGAQSGLAFRDGAMPARLALSAVVLIAISSAISFQILLPGTLLASGLLWVVASVLAPLAVVSWWRHRWPAHPVVGLHHRIRRIRDALAEHSNVQGIVRLVVENVLVVHAAALATSRKTLTWLVVGSSATMTTSLVGYVLTGFPGLLFVVFGAASVLIAAGVLRLSELVFNNAGSQHAWPLVLLLVSSTAAFVSHGMDPFGTAWTSATITWAAACFTFCAPLFAALVWLSAGLPSRPPPTPGNGLPAEGFLPDPSVADTPPQPRPAVVMPDAQEIRPAQLATPLPSTPGSTAVASAPSSTPRPHLSAPVPPPRATMATPSTAPAPAPAPAPVAAPAPAPAPASSTQPRRTSAFLDQARIVAGVNSWRRTSLVRAESKRRESAAPSPEATPTQSPAPVETPESAMAPQPPIMVAGVDGAASRTPRIRDLTQARREPRTVRIQSAGLSSAMYEFAHSDSESDGDVEDSKDHMAMPDAVRVSDGDCDIDNDDDEAIDAHAGRHLPFDGADTDDAHGQSSPMDPVLDASLQRAIFAYGIANIAIAAVIVRTGFVLPIAPCVVGMGIALASLRLESWLSLPVALLLCRVAARAATIRVPDVACWITQPVNAAAFIGLRALLSTSVLAMVWKLFTNGIAWCNKHLSSPSASLQVQMLAWSAVAVCFAQSLDAPYTLFGLANLVLGVYLATVAAVVPYPPELVHTLSPLSKVGVWGMTLVTLRLTNVPQWSLVVSPLCSWCMYKLLGRWSADSKPLIIVLVIGLLLNRQSAVIAAIAVASGSATFQRLLNHTTRVWAWTGAGRLAILCGLCVAVWWVALPLVDLGLKAVVPTIVLQVIGALVDGHADRTIIRIGFWIVDSLIRMPGDILPW